MARGATSAGKPAARRATSAGPRAARRATTAGTRAARRATSAGKPAARIGTASGSVAGGAATGSGGRPPPAVRTIATRPPALRSIATRPPARPSTATAPPARPGGARLTGTTAAAAAGSRAHRHGSSPRTVSPVDGAPAPPRWGGAAEDCNPGTPDGAHAPTVGRWCGSYSFGCGSYCTITGRWIRVCPARGACGNDCETVATTSPSYSTRNSYYSCSGGGLRCW